MIQLSRNYSLPEREEQIIPIKVIAVGSAGSNALDRVVLDGMDKSDLIAANTDAQSLASSVAAVKVQLGRSITRGLGTGGDPELGFDAAQEAADEIRQALTQARLIFICAGLGGGTGSGAAPVIAQIAREMGALVIAFATVPFTFEGKRRAAQARDALARLHESTDAVVCPAGIVTLITTVPVPTARNSPVGEFVSAWFWPGDTAPERRRNAGGASPGAGVVFTRGAGTATAALECSTAGSSLESQALQNATSPAIATNLVLTMTE